MLREHRAIDAALDALMADIAGGRNFRPAWIAAQNLLRQHYASEAIFLEELQRHAPGMAAKMAAQHDEVLEISGFLEQAWGANQEADTWRLVRRFHAIAQHNVIEEERDVFPVAARCFEF